MSSSTTTSTKRKRSRTSGDLLIHDPSREKYIQTMANKRRSKITRLFNLKPRNTTKKKKHSEEKRLTNLDVWPMRIKQKWFDKIKARKKNREFRDKSKPRYTTQFKNHKMVRYIYFYVTQNEDTDRMVIEFNGFDTEHELWFTHWVLKLGNIISTDPTEVKRLVYK